MKHDVFGALRTRAVNPVGATRERKDNPRTLAALQPHRGAGISGGPVVINASARDRVVNDSVVDGAGERLDAQRGDDPAAPINRSAAQSQVSLYSGDFSHDGLSLDYRICLPPVAQRNGALLVMLHGCTQDASDFAAGTAMDRLACESGYSVLYPTQNTTSNQNRCWNWFLPDHQQRYAGEPALLSTLVQSVCARHELDTSRVFVAGLSAGGAMALILAEEFPELFAGVGVHSGLPTGLAKSVPQALRAMTGSGKPDPVNPKTLHRPTLVIHGDQDKTVHPDNASLIVRRCLDQYRQQNSEEKLLYRCYEELLDGQLAQRHDYRDGQGKLVCRHWQLSSVGHAWSGGDARGSHTVTGGFAASQSLLSFFDDCQGRQ